MLKRIIQGPIPFCVGKLYRQEKGVTVRCERMCINPVIIPHLNKLKDKKEKPKLSAFIAVEPLSQESQKSVENVTYEPNIHGGMG